MRESNKGLTKTYNRFHDPKEQSPEIRRLRDLHAAMDRAVLAAYGWTDIDTTCGFDLDWCEDEAADDASPETIERLETGRYFFETAEEARAFATELVGLGKKLPWRYRWRPEVRDEVLARLLLLNKQLRRGKSAVGLEPLSPTPRPTKMMTSTSTKPPTRNPTMPTMPEPTTPPSRSAWECRPRRSASSSCSSFPRSATRNPTVPTFPRSAWECRPRRSASSS